MSKSLGDTTAHLSRAQLREEKVRAVARREPLIVEAGASLGETLEAMQRGRGECVLVCREGRLEGIVTERDVLLKVLGKELDTAQPVEDLMTRNPETASCETTVPVALQMMERGGYRNLPLVDDEGRIVGLLRQQDVIEYVAEAFPQEILNLPPRPHQTMEAEGG